MHRLLIVSHTPSDNTRAMTRAVVSGAQQAGMEAVTVVEAQALETGPDEVRSADGIILGSTENFGYMSGGMKDFFDRIYYPCLEETAALPYAMYIRAGNDGLGARTAIERIVKGLAWKPVLEPLVCTGKWDVSFLAQCEELGMTMAAGLEAGIW